MRSLDPVIQRSRRIGFSFLDKNVLLEEFASKHRTPLPSIMSLIAMPAFSDSKDARDDHQNMKNQELFIFCKEFNV